MPSSGSMLHCGHCAVSGLMARPHVAQAASSAEGDLNRQLVWQMAWSSCTLYEDEVPPGSVPVEVA